MQEKGEAVRVITLTLPEAERLESLLADAMERDDQHAMLCERIFAKLAMAPNHWLPTV